MFKILAINPGSTSTKVAVYEDEKELFVESIKHSDDELSKYDRVQDQYNFRKNLVKELLIKNNISINELSAIVGRGGLLLPVKSGAYKVNETMVDRLMNKPIIEHASNLGALIAYDMAKDLNVEAYIYDSVAVDELEPYAKVTGVPEISRLSHGHALNMRAAAINVAEKLGRRYEDLRLIVAHLGGGFTTSLHVDGKMIDIVGDEEGSFSPERSGGLQVRQVASFIMSWKGDKKELKKKLRGNAGLKALLGTADLVEVEKMIDSGNEYARLVYESMAYQVAKGIGALAIAAKGNIDRIILTGGIAYSKKFTDIIYDYVKFLAPVEIIPGENEMKSLSQGILRVLRGQEKAREYVEENN